MKYCVFSENEWVYPDSELGGETTARLFAARGGDVNFQILTDKTFAGGEAVAVAFSAAGCGAEVYQLLTARVTENSGPKTHTTTNYDEVKDFVTRRAPFEVYDVTKPVADGGAEQGRAAFWVRVNVASDAPVGEVNAALSLTFGGETLTVPVSLRIFRAQIPALRKATYHMVNWIYYPTLAKQHGVELWSKPYEKVLDEYLYNELDMRNDYLMLPTGDPVRDADGRVIDFDLSHAEAVGKRALELGFTTVMGGFVIQWLKWDAPELYLLWDKEIEVTTIEAYRQLKLYFTRVREMVERNGWKECYMQCLMDEPQFANASAYRVVGAICRKCIPGIRINDPVEASTLGGGLDVWVVKQAVYEKYIEDFRALQQMGEEVWIYTCGFPAGATMNRVHDLALTASRLPMWMCYKYGCPGFLHWGYHCHNEEGRFDVCYRVRERRFPAGNSFAVYPAGNTVWYSVRGHLQRTGAQDYELLRQLGERDRDKALALVEKVCRTFKDYETDGTVLDDTRRQLLEALE